MRHTFTAWALALRIDPNKLVHLIGHGSKKMIYEVYGNYMEGLETDAGQILGYFGKYFIGCMSSKGFGQIRYRNKRGFQITKTVWPLKLIILHIYGMMQYGEYLTNGNSN